MPAFAYRAVEAEGKRVRGKEEATSAQALIRSLERRGMVVLDVETTERSAAGPALVGRIGHREAVLEATRALASLLGAGMPLPRALKVTADVATERVGTALETIREEVERGDSTAVAMGRHPTLFSPLYVGVVRAGEKSGDIAESFERLGAQLEREQEIRSTLLTASIYPLLLIGLGGAAVAVLLLFVIPRFVELLEGSGAALPGSTALLLDISSIVQRFWPVLLALFGATVALVASSGRSETGRRVKAEVMARIPLISRLRRQTLAASFARLVGVLLGGGAPLLSALDDAHDSMADPIAKEEVARVRDRVREGATLHASISAGSLFPPLLGQLIAVGEEAGQLKQFLLKAAEIFESKTERTLERLVALAEPAMILLFGAIIAFVALALLQAIYGVNAGAFR